MRAFLAVPVGSPALEAGTALLAELHGAVPAVRWVRPEGLHLTLHFWASLHDDDVSPVVDAARAVASCALPYAMQLGGLGAFPRDGDERVLWLGMRDGAAETVALQRGIEDAIDAAGFAREPRAFHPHVTLGRPRARLDAASRAAWRGLDARATLPPCAVDTVCLYRSHPGAGGSRYEVLARLPLGVSASG